MPRAVINACPNVQALDSLPLMLVAQHVLGFLYNAKQKDELKSLGTDCVFGCSTTAMLEDGGGSCISGAVAEQLAFSFLPLGASLCSRLYL